MIQTLERYELSDAAREDYLASFEGDRFAQSMRYVQSYPTELAALREVLASIETPVQIISGSRDAVVPLVNSDYLHEQLPHSEPHIVDAGHFVWEDAADEYAARDVLVGRRLQEMPEGVHGGRGGILSKMLSP